MIELLLAALVLLPLFPASLVINAILQALPDWLRALLLFVLPAVGAGLLSTLPAPPTGEPLLALQVLAVLTALLYAWRLLAVREVFIWARLQATSAWPLVWLAWLHGLAGWKLVAIALALSLPAAALTLVACALRRRLGGAYVGLRGRLGAVYPRLAGAYAVVLVAALAAPPFPGFFAVLAVLHVVPATVVVALLVVWIVWSWAAAELWQKGLFGPGWMRPAGTDDLALAGGTVWVIAALLFIAAGLIGSWAWSML